MALKKENKKQQVRAMFNSVARRYDFLNHFLSAGIDYRWRRKAIKILAKNNPKTILDVATGTGDLAIAALKLNPKKVIGVDIAEDMVEIGKKKVREKKLEKIIHIQVGDSEDLQFNDNTFDAAIVAFGVRNFDNLEKGLSEMYRVLNNNGMVMILEFSKPTATPVRQLYQFYFKNILPFLGRIISGDNSAYTYLPKSVGEFPMGNEFLRILNKVGYTDTQHIPLTFGIASIYTGKKLK